ncbi:MAG: DUF3526 domain-containing protein [Phycisphaerae bacterium]|nr:DUF3526 domain-containing protein [Gemmatimonadaceae bacterium]
MLRADRLLGGLTLLFCLLAAYGIFNGQQYRAFQLRTLESLRIEESGRLDSLDGVMRRLEAGDSVQVSPAQDPRSPAVAGRSVATRWLVLQPSPLSALAVGQSDLQPYFVRVATTTRQTAIVNEEIENPVALLVGRLDMAFVVITLFPLFVLALTYNVLSAEREQGTMSLIASQAVSARRIMIAKIAVRALSVITLAVAVSVVGALAGGASLGSADSLARIAWWCAVVLAYGAFWFAAALLVNARGKSSAANAVTLLGVWFIFVIAVPSLVSSGIAAAYPVPPRLSLVTVARQVQDSIAAAMPRRANALADYLANHPEYRGSARADTSNPQVVGIANMNALELRLRPVYDEFDARLHARQDAAELFRFLSPALAAQNALLDAAGTSTRRFRAFETRWASFHDEWRAFFNSRVFSGTTMTRAELSGAPTPSFASESITQLSASILPSVLGVLIPALLLTLLSARAFNTSPVHHS